MDGPLRRRTDGRVLAGVCAGLSASTGIDLTVVRIGVVLASLGTGVGAAAYVVAWLVLVLDDEETSIFARAVRDRRGLRLVVAAVPVAVLLQAVASILHVGVVGTVGWPALVVAASGILIWRNASPAERDWLDHEVVPLLRSGSDGRTRWAVLVRVGAAAVLCAAGVLVLVLGRPVTAAVLRPVAGAFLVVAAVVLVFLPWWLHLVRDLLAERQARALAEERSRMAAHVHDSVLQTLALIQRGADDPQQVVRLARAQERELRSWLFEGRPPGTVGAATATLAGGMAEIQHQVESDHGATVHLVVVGDRRLDDDLRAVLAAAREATVNAARWSGVAEVSLYAEATPGSVSVFVRDRGRGFDPAAVPADRQGIAQSIRGRMERCGGSAVVRTAPGHGVEVELTLPVRGTA